MNAYFPGVKALKYMQNRYACIKSMDEGCSLSIKSNKSQLQKFRLHTNKIFRLKYHFVSIFIHLLLTFIVFLYLINSDHLLFPCFLKLKSSIYFYI